MIAESLRSHCERLSATFWSTLRDPSRRHGARFLAGMAPQNEPERSLLDQSADDEFLVTQLLNSKPDDQRECAASEADCRSTNADPAEEIRR